MIRYLPPKTQTGQEEQADEHMVNRRLLVLRGVVIVIFALFVLRLWYMQILTGERYQVKADELRFKRHLATYGNYSTSPRPEIFCGGSWRL